MDDGVSPYSSDTNSWRFKAENSINYKLMYYYSKPSSKSYNLKKILIEISFEHRIVKRSNQILLIQRFYRNFCKL